MGRSEPRSCGELEGIQFHVLSFHSKKGKGHATQRKQTKAPPKERRDRSDTGKAPPHKSATKLTFIKFFRRKENGRPTQKRLRKQHQGRGEKAPLPTLCGVVFPSPLWWCCLPSPLWVWGCFSSVRIWVVLISLLFPVL